jgi:hypothetical protein
MQGRVPAPDQAFSKTIAVVAFVGDGMAVRWQHQILGRDYVGTLTGCQNHLRGTPATINQRGQLGVKPAFGASNGLILLAASGFGRILVNLDVEMTQSAGGAFGKQIQNGRPRSCITPTSPPGIHRTPFGKVSGQVAPRATGAQQMNHRLKHLPMILGRSAATTTRRRHRYRKPGILNQFFYPLPKRVREEKAIRGTHMYKWINKRSLSVFYSENLF